MNVLCNNFHYSEFVSLLEHAYIIDQQMILFYRRIIRCDNIHFMHVRLNHNVIITLYYKYRISGLTATEQESLWSHFMNRYIGVVEHYCMLWTCDSFVRFRFSGIFTARC